MSVALDFTPAEVRVTVTQGDVLREITLTCTLEDGSPWNLSSVKNAAVRRRRSRASASVLSIPASVAANVVTLGPVTIPADPGVWWWDCEVSDADGALTIVAGSFRILEDISDV